MRRIWIALWFPEEYDEVVLKLSSVLKAFDYATSLATTDQMRLWKTWIPMFHVHVD
jgi:hypothetical protein